MSFPCQVGVCLLLIKDNKLLLMKRSGTGFGDGYWAVPGGRIDGQESVTEACRREALEELGIKIAAKELKFATAIHSAPHDENPREVVLFIFKAEHWDGKIVNNEPHKCEKIGFFPLDDLPEGTMTSTKRFIQNAFQGVSFEEMFWDASS
jgi:8-oxo-dGTP diphosphatase